jgi:hypothetical protein
MKILFSQSDFDGACTFLAKNNPTYGGDPDRVAASIWESLKAFRDPAISYAATGGYVLIAAEDELEEDLHEDGAARRVDIFVVPGVGKPYKEVVIEV